MERTIAGDWSELAKGMKWNDPEDGKARGLKARITYARKKMSIYSFGLVNLATSCILHFAIDKTLLMKAFRNVHLNAYRFYHFLMFGRRHCGHNAAAFVARARHYPALWDFGLLSMLTTCSNARFHRWMLRPADRAH
ncbi:hypothetical protein ALC56_10381 [Trachymyrmex septentrionalis]|uniref:Uncharacterized protein n=1 Tax=Trachymyrmex septentrionalis TaxID=34720 RepID=A0A195F495_9HYME|nr:hypothetical protein ALC56_10381 [Trachymyrmex septentrionalis]